MSTDTPGDDPSTQSIDVAAVYERHRETIKEYCTREDILGALARAVETVATEGDGDGE
jgi:hypothetical protein